MRVELNREEIEQAIEGWVERQVDPAYVPTKVVIGGNGQSATVVVEYRPTVDSIRQIETKEDEE